MQLARIRLDFFLKNTPTTEIYTLSLHDALPILAFPLLTAGFFIGLGLILATRRSGGEVRSEEHTSELQSHHDLVCRLLLEKKKVIKSYKIDITDKISL